MENKMEKKLREKIECVYKAYKERNFEKLLSYSATENNDEKEDMERRIREMNELYPVLVDYEIKEIKIEGDKAKVKVTMTVILDNVKNMSDSYDYWVFQNNDWRLSDFGKIL
jgi:hypothetical protein